MKKLKKKKRRGRPRNEVPSTRRNLYVPADVLALYDAKIAETGRKLNEELLTAIRRHVGLE